MGAGEGGGSKLWSIIWFIVLITVAFELAFVCAALYILLNPLTLCIEGLKVKLFHTILMLCPCPSSVILIR